MRDENTKQIDHLKTARQGGQSKPEAIKISKIIITIAIGELSPNVNQVIPFLNIF